MTDTPFAPELLEPDLWCALSDRQRRDRLAGELWRLLHDAAGAREASIGMGPVDRPYDLTAILLTDVGALRTPLWSHARATIFCDSSVHPANRKQLAPGFAVQQAADQLRRRTAVQFNLEARGLTLTLSPEPGVERTWTADRSRFRGRTAVTREDRIDQAADVDLRDLLAHFYTGPALRCVNAAGDAFLLPAAAEPEPGALMTLCMHCRHWSEGAHAACLHCGGAADVVVSTPASRR